MKLRVELTIVSDSAPDLAQAKEMFLKLPGMLNKQFEGRARVDVEVKQEK
jgi:hypothetical protein